MLLVLPRTSPILRTPYLAPQSYDYYPSHDYYLHYGEPKFPEASYSSQPDLFVPPLAEELEEYEYQRALEVVINHRRRQAEREGAIYRQPRVEAARQLHFAAWAAELEQRRQEELLIAHHVELVRSHRARACLVAAERQHDLNLEQAKNPQTVCHFRTRVMYLNLICSPPQVAHQPRIAKRESLVDVLKQCLTAESNANIAETIKNVLSSLEPRSVELEKAGDSGEDASTPVENFLSSILSGPFFRTQPQPTTSAEQVESSASNKAKGKARAADTEEPHKPTPKPESTDEAFADVLRHVMEFSRSAPAPRSPDQPGPSGSSSSSTPPVRQVVTESEQGQIDRAIALSSVEHIQNTLAKLQSEFILPTGLDRYTASTNGRDGAYKFETELNGLLEELDGIDSHGDVEVREKRKEVVKAVETALEGLQRVVGEAVEKGPSLMTTSKSVTGGPLKGFGVHDNITNKTAPAQDQVGVPVIADDAAVPKPSAPAQVEETVANLAEVVPPIEEALLESDTPAVSETVSGPISTGSGEEISAKTTAPASVEPKSTTDIEPREPQVQSNAPEAVDTLLPEKASSPSPVRKLQQINNDSDNEVVSVDSDAEKSDWSELEHSLG